MPDMSVKRVKEVDWPMAVSAGVIGAIAATVLLFPAIGILSLLNLLIGGALGIEPISSDDIGPIFLIVWILGFVTFVKRLDARQIPSQIAGDGLMISAKLALLAIPLILITMIIAGLTTRYPLSITGVVSWIIPIALIAVSTGTFGFYLRRRARKQLEKQ